MDAEVTEQELEGLSDTQLQPVADFIALKFRDRHFPKVTLDSNQLSDLFTEFAELVANDSAIMLTREDRRALSWGCQSLKKIKNKKYGSLDRGGNRHAIIMAGSRQT